MLRRLIGWLANFYPNTVFYSRDFMPDLTLKLDNVVHGSKGSTAMIGVAIAAGRKMDRVGDVLTATFTGVTDGGAEIGDFTITIERIH